MAARTQKAFIHLKNQTMDIDLYQRARSLWSMLKPIFETRSNRYQAEDAK